MSPVRTAVGAASPPDPPEGLIAKLYGELEEAIHYATWRESGSHPTGHDLDTMARQLGRAVVAYYEAERQMLMEVQRAGLATVAATQAAMDRVRTLWAERPGMAGPPNG